MAIDRIGKGGGVPPTPEAQGTGAAKPVSAPEAPERKFEVDATKRTSEPDAVSASSPLGRLRAGEIDVNGYVDLKVDEATAGLKGLSVHELDAVKGALRDQMKTDPGLVDLVRSATGKIPTPPED